MEGITLSDLKEFAHLANVVLIPAVWLLWKIQRKIDILVVEAKAHAKEDIIRFSEGDRRMGEFHDRLITVEEKVNG